MCPAMDKRVFDLAVITIVQYALSVQSRDCGVELDEANDVACVEVCRCECLASLVAMGFLYI